MFIQRTVPMLDRLSERLKKEGLVSPEPKASRDAKFRYAFQLYMASVSSEASDNHLVWELSSLTPNKRGMNQDYKLVIPSQYPIGEITARYIDPNTEEVQGPGPIMVSQSIPSILQMHDAFIEHFDPWTRLYIPEQKIADSYVHITNSQFINGELVCEIRVLYSPGYLPFYVPNPIEPFDQTEYIRDLESQLATQTELAERSDRIRNRLREQRIVDMHTIYECNDEIIKLKKTNNKNMNMIDRMRQYIRTTFEAATDREDCPVCMTAIAPDQLFIPNCCHLLCSSCSERCAVCPICRDAFY